MWSLALVCSALVAAAAFAVPNERTYVEATQTTWKGGAGEPRNMTAYEDYYHWNREFYLDLYEDDKRQARSKQPAPLVCFVRYDGFMNSGVMRFTVQGIPVKKCTHVVYSYLETDNRTGEFLYRKMGPLSQADIEKDVALLKRRQPKLKVLYSYGGGAHTMSMLNRLSTKNDEEKLFRTLDSLVEPGKFDGVNLHLEGPGPSICNKESFNKILNFIKKVRFKIMHVDDLLTIQLPACRPKCDAIVKRKLARYVDYIFLMTFDYKLDDLSTTKLTSGLKLLEGTHLSTIDTVTCLKQWVDAGVPKYKMVPGIATYSRTFTLNDPYSYGIGAKLAEKHPLGYGANFTMTDGYMNYVEACRRLKYYDWEATWVQTAGMAYLHYKDQWISYEDETSAAAKALWFRSQGMGGVFVWSLDADDYSGDCVGELFPIVDSVWKALNGYRPVTTQPLALYRGKEVREAVDQAGGRVTAPLACFMRGEAFERVGIRRFSLNTLPLGMCTHLIYSYVETDNDTGEFIFRQRGATGERNILRDMGMLRHKTSATEVRTLVSYGGGAHLQSLLKRIREPQKMWHFLRKMKHWLVVFGLDGINFHLEGPGPPLCKRSDIVAICNFIRQLRSFLGDGYLITLQLPACRDPNCSLFPYERIASQVNYFFLMTFDYKLDELSKTKITSGLYYYEGNRSTSVESESCLGRWINVGVPKHKIIPGVATYGRSFTLRDPDDNGVSATLDPVHPLGYGANFTQTDGYMNYVETCRRVNYFHWKRYWLKYAATPYIHYENQWVSYDDKDSVKVKAEWFWKHWLGGIFVWSLDADDYGGDCVQDIYPMVRAAWKVLKTNQRLHMRAHSEQG
ncbi:probable chitinase 10 isoform X2 [Dermacentor andersoni]|nr:probable chitinase 10 isoform X2 [Dermacentor andersoni]XP_054932709.1 probable chitinase 10 isoform X2 [Dermacentor andersoni]XP_054932710.1 probable chitinase 10 isoform X2 [Dermacentor andersoni]XP_054932711.1 probable chitinase 10 isoform X2 [Dermacentor andersoni]XP_054932712.1 probable chitinase 10 isoform X2 [Dermacentor andersoni]